MAPLEAAYPALRLSSLVAELAAGLRPPADIWRDNGVVTRADAAVVASLPVFQQMLAEARHEWHARSALPLRVKAKAGALIEDALPFMHAGILNPFNPLVQRVAAFTALSKMAGVEVPPESRVGGGGGGGGPGAGVAISISMDLGGGNVVGVHVTETVDVAAAGDEGDEGDEGDGEFLLNPADYLVGADADNEGDGEDGDA